MEPGLVRNDRILVQKMSYWFGGSPERGDVVVFKDPGGWLNATDAVGPTNPVAKVMAKIGLYPQGGHLVKRVIGVEGDVIECCDKRGRISVNGDAAQRGPLRQGRGRRRLPRPDARRLRLEGRAGAGGPHLRDGRQPRPLRRLHRPHVHRRPDRLRPGDEFVPVDLVVGKVFVLLWPADHFRLGPAARHLRGRARTPPERVPEWTMPSE